MKAFAYVNAANQAEAVAAMATAARGKTLPLAGGMDLISLMKDYVAQPEVLVNVKKLPATISTAAAISNAIANAIGVRVRSIPLTPEKVLAAIATRGTGGTL